MTVNTETLMNTVLTDGVLCD